MTNDEIAAAIGESQVRRRNWSMTEDITDVAKRECAKAALEFPEGGRLPKYVVLHLMELAFLRGVNYADERIVPAQETGR